MQGKRIFRHVAVAILALFAPAMASGGEVPLPITNLVRLEPSASAVGSLLIGTGELLPAGGFRLSLSPQYERNPLLFVHSDAEPVALVSNRVLMHVSAVYAPTRWLELGLQAPGVAFQSGDDLTREGLRPPDSSSVGSPHVHGRFQVLRQTQLGLADVALEMGLGVPLGADAAFVHDPGLRFEPKVSAGRLLGKLRAGLEVGWIERSSTSLNPYVTNVQAPVSTDQEAVGRELHLGASIASTGKRFRWEADVVGSLSMASSPHAAEALGGVRYLLTPAIEVYALGGVGLGAAPGTPLFRVLAGVAVGNRMPWSLCDQPDHDPAQCPEEDFDRDGIANAADLCPKAPVNPEARSRKPVGCPWVDADKDGFHDMDGDNCPGQWGPPDFHGCPEPDEDKDGLANSKDKCPYEAGPEALQGCPDSDGDEIPNYADACPEQKGEPGNKGCPNIDADSDGVEDDVDSCPETRGGDANYGCPIDITPLVQIDRHANRLALLKSQKVLFEKDRAKIQTESYPLLDWVIKVLQGHPALRIRIEAHTDNAHGTDESRRQLTQTRADAVKDYLSRQIDPKRLDSKGRGSEHPVDDSNTSLAREKNRRVEFVIINNEEAPGK